MLLLNAGNDDISKLPDDEFWKKVMEDPLVRQEVTRKDFRTFINVYFTDPEDKDQVPLAPFHEEMMAILQDQKENLIVFEAFRGSAKTSLANIGYVLWSIIGKLQKKNVVIVSQTQDQSKQILANAKLKMSKGLLKDDMGPFAEESETWRSDTVVIKKYEARITITSIDGAIRGSLHGTRRPDLILCDDMESLATVQTLESRDKLYAFFTGDLLPAGGASTRTVVLGTRLNEDSLIMRLQEDISRGRRSGIFKSYPLIDSGGAVLWLAKYPNMEAVEAERLRIGNEEAWSREYLLTTISNASRVIWPEWIEPYDELPETEDLRRILISVDPAVSEDEKAAYTAIVVFYEFVIAGKPKLYVAAHPVNERMTFHEMQEKIKNMYFIHASRGPVEVVVEGVAAQQYIYQELFRNGINAKACTVKGKKRERLAMAGAAVQAKIVYFPRTGCEALKQQIIGFDHEHFKDLADAFSQGVIELLKVNEPERIVASEDVHYYKVDAPPQPSFIEGDQIRIPTGNASTGIRLAIGEKDVGKNTAMVTGRIFFNRPERSTGTLLIMPNPVNAQMSFQKILDTTRELFQKHESRYYCFFIEKMSPEDAAVEALARIGGHVMPILGFDDRRTNFIVAAKYIKDGTVRFPDKGCEELVRQMVNYDVESHTELVDAMAHLILGVIREEMTRWPRDGCWSAYDPKGTGYHSDAHYYFKRI